MKNPLNVVAAFGLALGGVFGMVGTIVTQRNLQAASWGVDGVGLVVATTLLALKFFRSGNDVVAAGFLVFAIAAGAALWSAALLRTSVSREFAVWVRLAGMIGSILFAITAARVFWGEQVLPTSSPLRPSSHTPFSCLHSSAGFGSC